MDFLLAPAPGLWGLFLASFFAATLLPGGSEAVFLVVVSAHPEVQLVALLLATLGNTLGGMSTFFLGRALPAKVGADKTARWTDRHTRLLQRFGPGALLLAWTPLLGDALCAAAGWLRLAWLPCMIAMALGKGLRYAAILLAMSAAN
jgi:membrane protein YqaA with SNARE-associated domain